MSTNQVSTEHLTASHNAVPGEGYVLGFDIGGTNTVGVLADLRGDVLAEARSTTARYYGQDNYGQVFVTLRDELVQRAGVPPHLTKTAGLSVAGVVEPGTGRVVTAPNLSQDEFDLAPIVEGVLGVPVTIENDVNLAAVGEHWQGAARGCENFIFVALGTGVGAGIFTGGRLYHGAHNAAGEIGYLYVHGIEQIDPRGLGAFEKRVSGPGIAAAARDRLLIGGSSSRLSGVSADALRSEEVWAAASEGDPLASEVLSEVLDTIALGLANAVSLLDPELVVLGGGISRVGDALLVPLRERLSQLLAPPLAPRLELSVLGPRAQLYGAIRQALDHAVR